MGENLLEDYLNARASKDELKKGLKKLSEAVFEETQHPLVFIIDELDRCRPTFAIELLERVKHIFDVPYLVFVFGINRDELCKSLSSIYGEINTDVYLRRFFDFEFQLQEVDSQAFAAHLIDQFQLGEAFQSLDNALDGAKPSWSYPGFKHSNDYDNFKAIVPKLWSALGLSLRDMDYGIRLLALLAKNLRPGSFSHPFLLAVMVALRFRKPEYYRQLKEGHFRASEFMDYFHAAVRQNPLQEELVSGLDRIEGLLYCFDDANDQRQNPGELALEELRKVRSASPNTSFSVISRRSQNADQYQLREMEQAIYEGRFAAINGRSLGELVALIDTYQTHVMT